LEVDHELNKTEYRRETGGDNYSREAEYLRFKKKKDRYGIKSSQRRKGCKRESLENENKGCSSWGQASWTRKYSQKGIPPAKPQEL